MLMRDCDFTTFCCFVVLSCSLGVGPLALRLHRCENITLLGGENASLSCWVQSSRSFIIFSTSGNVASDLMLGSSAAIAKPHRGFAQFRIGLLPSCSRTISSG